MKKHISSIILMATALLIAGCSSPPAEFADGYQFGDITRFTARELMNIESARETYCDQTSSSASKRLAIMAIQTQLPAYPVDGVCTALMDVLLPKTGETTHQPIDAKARESPG